MDMNGMPMAMDSIFHTQFNWALARSFWYVVAGVVGALAIVRGLNHLKARERLRACRDPAIPHPSRPLAVWARWWATMTALCREIKNPELHIARRWLSWLSPPPLGRILVLAIYWSVILYMMFTNDVVIDDVYFFERIGYRNAWVTLSQLPLIYLLAAKVNVIGFLTHSSHERLNWLHRWVARTMFIVATVHGFHFWTEWVRSDYVSAELSSMPTIKYGLGAWAVLLWIVVSSIYPIRHWAYEVFVIQHVIAATLLIWLIYVHVPPVALWVVWLTVAIVAFDRLARLVSLLRRNVRLLPFGIRKSLGATGGSLVRKLSFPLSKCPECSTKDRIGHRAQVQVMGDSTILTIRDVHMAWAPGQYLYLWLPRLGPWETHPYTISRAHQAPNQCVCNSIQLIIRAHAGFSRRLHTFGQEQQRKGNQAQLRAFISSPYGAPPRVDIYETLVLVSASTGASFTLPLLESLVINSTKTSCLLRVDFIILARRRQGVAVYLQRVIDIADRFRRRGIKLRVHVAITSSAEADAGHKGVTIESDMSANLPQGPQCCQPDPLSISPREDAVVDEPRCCQSDPLSTSPREDATVDEARCCQPGPLSTPSGEDAVVDEARCCHPDGLFTFPREDAVVDVERFVLGTDVKSSVDAGLKEVDSFITEYSCRPDLECLIRDAVEGSFGETSVVVCGGPSLTSRVRNFVSSLSDERAVHKGTGAQGIHLYVEEYSL